MKKISVSIISWFVCLLALYIKVSIAENGMTEEPQVIDQLSASNCRRMFLLMAKKQMKVFSGCMKELKQTFPDKEEFTKRFQCVIKCAMSKEGMIDEKMMMSNQTVQYFFDKNIPEHYQKIGHVIVDGCSKEWADKFDPADEYCQAYGNFVKCCQNYVAEMCATQHTTEHTS